MNKSSQDTKQIDCKCSTSGWNQPFEYFCPSTKKCICFNWKMRLFPLDAYYNIDRSPDTAESAISNFEEVFQVFDRVFDEAQVGETNPGIFKSSNKFKSKLEKLSSYLHLWIKENRYVEFSFIQSQVWDLYKKFYNSKVIFLI